MAIPWYSYCRQFVMACPSSFFLAMLGEMGLLGTCPILEGLLVFTGFQIALGAYVVASIPFLVIACAGRLCGFTSAYWISSPLGDTIIDKFGRHIQIYQGTPRVGEAKTTVVCVAYHNHGAVYSRIYCD